MSWPEELSGRVPILRKDDPSMERYCEDTMMRGEPSQKIAWMRWIKNEWDHDWILGRGNILNPG